MTRRKFVALFGSMVAAPMIRPLVARAQQAGRTYRLGVLLPSGRQTPPVVAFFDELRLLGFTEGQNLEVIPGGFDIRPEQATEVAAATVKAAPDVVYAGGLVAARAIQAATTTVPIVALTQDLVADRLVASLARPGGNITGISLVSHQLDGKRLEFLMEAAPAVKRMAILADTGTSTPQHLKLLQDSARVRGVELAVFTISRQPEIASVLATAKAAGAGAVNVLSSPLFGAYSSRPILFAHTMALKLPAIYEFPEIAEEGGLAAYGPRLSGIFRHLAQQIVRVLRSGKTSDVPVQQPTNFELVLNLKTAKTIGHEIPAGLVLRADKLIE